MASCPQTTSSKGQRCITNYVKTFWEKLIAYLPLIKHELYRKEIRDKYTNRHTNN
jgi:hypothetical protein